MQKRGSSFKGVCGYILHDAGKATADRVDWTATQNLVSHPEQAWFEMFETYRDSDELKERAGRAARGRKNTTPVLHYMLSWHKDDNPSPEHMRETALSSLKALGLQDHQALLAAHHDKEHMHVHIVVNTVNPDNGMTAALKFTKLDLSKWAEAYEREHGIHCEERIKNNAERERLAKARGMDATALLMGQRLDANKQLKAASEIERKPRKPYVPVKHKATSRSQWLDKKEITDRVRVLRSQLDAVLKSERDATWERQTRERDTIDAETKVRIDQARAAAKDKYRPQWRHLYSTQKKEARLVDRLAGNIFERAAYVYQNRDRLGMGGTPLTLRQMMPLIRSGKQLSSRVAKIHETERRALAREAKLDTKEMTDAVWQSHKFAMGAICERHVAERQAEKTAQAQQRKSISFDMAKAALLTERANAPRAFVKAPEPRPVREPKIERAPPQRNFAQPPALRRPPEPPPVQQEFQRSVDPAPLPAAPLPALSRSEQIKRDAAEWSKRHDGRDFGREM